jgi:hypothetical protein
VIISPGKIIPQPFAVMDFGEYIWLVFFLWTTSAVKLLSGGPSCVHHFFWEI